MDNLSNNDEINKKIKENKEKILFYRNVLNNLFISDEMYNSIINAIFKLTKENIKLEKSIKNYNNNLG